MASSYDKPGYGNMWMNKDKKSEHAPDFVGTIMLEIDYKAGSLVKIGMWRKKTKHGDTFFSLREDNFIEKKKRENRVTEDREVKPAYAVRNNDDDDVPW